MEFIIANEGIPQNIGCEGATIAYYGSEIEFHYETVPPHGDEIFSAELPLLDIKLPFWMYGRNLIFLDAYYLLAETVEAHTLKNIGSSEDWNTIMNMESILNILMKDYS